MLYRVYTEDMNREGIHATAEALFDGYTVFAGEGSGVG